MVRRPDSSARRTLAYAVFVGVTFGLAVSIVTMTRHSESEEVAGKGQTSTEGLLRKVILDEDCHA